MTTTNPSASFIRTLALPFFAAAVLAVSILYSRAAPSLEAGWQNPPNHARLRAYWWWLNGNVTKASITRDLEQMQAKGFGGAVIFDAGGASQDDNDPVPHGPTFFSPAWRELYQHTLREADRLDLEISLNIQSGWNLGGPASVVSQEDAGKKYVWSEMKITGGADLQLKLPPPKARDNYYRDTAVVAYRLTSAPGNNFSVTASSSQPDYPAKLATDGDASTFWVSSGTQAGEGPTREKPEWLQITFDKPTTVSEVKISGRAGHGPREGELQISTDGQKFQAVKSFSVTDGETATVNWPAVTAASVRIVFFSAFDTAQPQTPRNVQVAELQLTGVPVKNSASHAPLQNWKQKALQESLMPFSAPDSSPLFAEIPATPGEQDANAADVLDLTKHLSADGDAQVESAAGRLADFTFRLHDWRSFLRFDQQRRLGRLLD